MKLWSTWLLPMAVIRFFLFSYSFSIIWRNTIHGWKFSLNIKNNCDFIFCRDCKLFVKWFNSNEYPRAYRILILEGTKELLNWKEIKKIKRIVSTEKFIDQHSQPYFFSLKNIRAFLPPLKKYFFTDSCSVLVLSNFRCFNGLMKYRSLTVTHVK